MYRMLAALGRGFKKRIGWKRLGVAASLVIIAFAVATLVRTLKGIDAGVILVALTEIPTHRIALAALSQQFIDAANASGIPMEVLHRVASMASGGSLTLPISPLARLISGSVHTS